MRIQLYRSRDNKLVLGICGGLAHHFNISANLLRVVFLILIVATSGIGLIIYIILWFIMPLEPKTSDHPQGTPELLVKESPNDTYDVNLPKPATIYDRITKTLQHLVGRSSQKASTSSQSTTFSIVQDADTSETSEIINVQEFPLDNTHGANLLRVEQEISKTTTNQLRFQSLAEKEWNFNIDFFSRLESAIRTKLSNQIGQDIEETITRRQTVTFSVAPYSKVTYVVIWKQKVRSGNLIISINQEQFPLPYTMYYDLSCEIKTRSAEAPV